VDSIYLSCISLATVGYGDIHPKTEGGYAFTTVWLLCGTVVIAKAIGSSLTYVMDRQRYQYMMDTFDPSDMNSGKIMQLDSVRALLRFAPRHTGVDAFVCFHPQTWRERRLSRYLRCVCDARAGTPGWPGTTELSGFL